MGVFVNALVVSILFQALIFIRVATQGHEKRAKGEQYGKV